MALWVISAFSLTIPLVQAGSKISIMSRPLKRYAYQNSCDAMDEECDVFECNEYSFPDEQMTNHKKPSKTKYHAPNRIMSSKRRKNSLESMDGFNLKARPTFLTMHSEEPHRLTSGNRVMRHTFSDAAMNPSASNMAVPDNQSMNALYDVSQEFLRVSGYRRQYNRLLSSGGAASPPGSAAGHSHDSVVDPDQPAEHHKLLKKVSECDETAFAILEQEISKATGKGQEKSTASKNVYAMQKKNKDVYYTRKQLMDKRVRACDLSVVFALSGVSLTIMEAELSATGVIEKGLPVSDALKSLVVVSTILLLAYIIKYHCLTTKILLISTGADDWRVTLQWDRVLQCTVEILICMICPVPGYIEIEWRALSVNDPTYRTSKIPLDAILSVPMFLRTYLLCRYIAMHNRKYQDAATRSIAALNFVNVDFVFALKTMLHERPLRVLLTFVVTFWAIMAWLLTQCERYSNAHEKTQYLNALWLVIVTFTSIGYGDLVPQTYCGRALAITTGIMGAGVSSTVIAVISRRMELSRAELHVNQFISDSKLAIMKKNTAAQILQQTWLIHRCKKSVRTDQSKLRTHQRKFLSAINRFRWVKFEMRKLSDQGCAVLDLTKIQNHMHQSMWNMRRGQDAMTAQIESMNREIDGLLSMLRCSKASSPAE